MTATASTSAGSYASGTSDRAPARRHDRREPRAHRRPLRRPRGAGRLPHRAAAGPTPSSTPRSTRSPAACSPSASARATGSASGRRTAPSGCSCSTPPRRSARSWSTSTRPTAPTSWLTCSASRASRCWFARRRSRPATTRRWSRRCAATARRCARSCSSGRRRWDALVDGARAACRTRLLRERDGGAVLRRPDQHPVHVGHHRLPEGRDALAPQHPQQRLLRRRGAAATPSRTGSASRCPSTTASAW